LKQPLKLQRVRCTNTVLLRNVQQYSITAMCSALKPIVKWKLFNDLITTIITTHLIVR